MRKKGRIIGIILAVILVLCVSVFVWQYDNIMAIIQGMRYTNDDISVMLEDNQKLEEEVFESYSDVELNGLGDEELQAFEQGEITEDDFVDIVLGKTSLDEAKEANAASSSTSEKASDSKPPASSSAEKPEKQEKPKQPAEKPAEPSKSEEEKQNEEIAEILAEFYVQKSKFTSKLNSIVTDAENEFYSHPQEEWSATLKKKVVASKLSELMATESECDAQINALLSRLSDVLKSQGKDLSMVDSIKKLYNNEKQLKKSAFMARYLEHL